jgi:hypothetical protein
MRVGAEAGKFFLYLYRTIIISMRAKISKLGKAFLKNSKAAAALSEAVFNNRDRISNGEKVQFKVVLSRSNKPVEFTAAVRSAGISQP